MSKEIYSKLEESKTVECEDIHNLVEKIFSKPPEEKNKYVVLPKNAESAHDIFKFLGQFLTFGITYIYGDNVDIRNLSNNEIQTLNKYIESIGFKTYINSTPLPSNKNILPWVLKLPTLQGQTKNYVNIIFEFLE